MNIKPLILALALLLAQLLIFEPPSIGQAPAINFKHIRYEDGLSNSTIECIYQDKRGFIWLGTRDGLNRFDGSQVKSFKTEDNNKFTISDNYITSICEDAEGKLWVGTINGLNCFDPTLDKFTFYKNDPLVAGSLSNNHITSIIKDKKNRLWISTMGGGINQFEKNNNQFISYSRKQNQSYSLVDDKVYCLFEDSRGNIWAGTERGVQFIEQRTGNFKTPSSLHAVNYAIVSIKEDKAGNLLFGSASNGLINYDPVLNAIKQWTHTATNGNSISSNLVRSVLVTNKGTIWVGTVNGGLDLFDVVTGKFYNYQYELNNPKSLSQRTVSALLEDNQGNLWVGTHRGGVNLYMPKSEKFALFKQEKRENSLSYNDVKSFCEDHLGNIWIGTDGGGLNQFDRETKTFTHFKFDPGNNRSLGSNEVISITEDGNYNLWVGTWGGGLCLFNRSSQSFTRYRNEGVETSLSSNYIQAVFEDSKKRLWVATYYGGLNLFDPSRKLFSRILTSASGKTVFAGNNVVSINEDKKGNIWIGTDDGGLNCLNASTGEFSHYFDNTEKKPDLRTIFIDDKGRVWAGQKGLYLFDEKQNQFISYTTKAGLSEEFIKSIVADNNGVFWIATSNGITQFDPKTFAFRKYNTADGLQGMEFEANAFLKTRNGEIYFGGVNGFNSFYPQDIEINSFVPPVYITDFELFDSDDKSFLQNSISYTKKITLSHKQSTFSLMFAALNYTASENNRFAYKLEDWDKDWVIAGKEKKASYTNVSPGEYIFRVKASNNDDIWNEEGQSITIIVRPPFWGTWWFRSLLALILGAGIYSFYRFRQKLHRRKLEEEKKEEIHQSQLQFFTNISHEFRTPLSLILGPAERLIKEEKESPYHHFYKVIHRNAGRLMNLINELMDFRKAESGVLKLNVMPGNIGLFFQEIEEEFSEMAYEKNISFSIHSEEIKNEIWFDRQILEKILVNLISNSFKYTASGGTISVETLRTLKGYKPLYENELYIPGESKYADMIYIRVADNGIGISKKSMPHLFERYYKVSDFHLGSGIGLAFVKTITALHKGTIHVYSEQNKGTEIIIGIPCSREDYSENERWIKPGSKSLKFDMEITPVAEERGKFSSLGKLESTPLQQYKILIVDDNDELRNFLKESLGKEYKIEEATDGEAGLIAASETHPDLIISDIMMPIMNGVDFCKRIKEEVEVSHIPFMMLTAKDSLQSKIEGTDAGADYYFAKPISIELLKSTLENIFIQKEKLREKYHKDHYSEVKEIVQSGKDRGFLEAFIAVVEDNLSSPEMDINYICKQVGMSRTKLYNKIKSITGEPIGEFIRTIRLKKAAKMLTEQDISLAEVMYSVGIQTQSYFTKAFKAEFGKTPSQFLKEIRR